jgi:hypothetical protein
MRDIRTSTWGDQRALVLEYTDAARTSRLCNALRFVDAPPPDKVIAHTNLYWTYQTAPGRKAVTIETKSVDFGGTR